MNELSLQVGRDGHYRLFELRSRCFVLKAPGGIPAIFLKAVMNTEYIAVDLGAASGRIILATLEHKNVRMETLHRFRTPLVKEGDKWFWDIDLIIWKKRDRTILMAIKERLKGAADIVRSHFQ